MVGWVGKYLVFLLFFYHFLKFLIGVQLLYHVVLVSAIQQRESVINIHVFTPS